MTVIECCSVMLMHHNAEASMCRLSEPLSLYFTVSLTLFLSLIFNFILRALLARETHVNNVKASG